MRGINAAYQDALCLLDEALQEQVISLDQFLKARRDSENLLQRC